MRRRYALVGAILGLGGFTAAGAPASSSGIAGRVLAGPTCPVQTIPPQPGCAPRPLAVTLRIDRVASRGRPVDVRSRAAGRFRVRLSPGTYSVRGLARTGSPWPRPPSALRVRVSAGRFTRITITYDTGIR